MRQKGFTLVEILISLSILVVGVLGILTLFPAGLSATKNAIEDTYAATIAESAYASLRAAAKQKLPEEDNIIFFHDGIDPENNSFPLPARGQSTGIPGPTDAVTNSAGDEYFRELTDTPDDENIPAVPDYDQENFCLLGQNREDNAFDTDLFNENTDSGQLAQYSFNIELFYPQKTSGKDTPRGLYDVIIRVMRGNKLVKKFYSKIAIPTNQD